MAEKKILIVNNTMGQGGAEVALIALMKELLRLTECSIDLYVMLDQGELIDSVPSGVNILNKKIDSSDVLSDAGRARLYRHTLPKLFRRFSGMRNLPYMISNYRHMRRSGNVVTKNLLWKAVSDGTEPPAKKYDLAIAFIEGASAYYVADKVSASVKAAFFHTDYHKAGYSRRLDHGCYSRFQAIFCVSQEAREAFLSEYPELEDRVHVFRNIIDPADIIEKSKAGEGFNDGFDGMRIISMGRLVKLKRYDIAIEAAGILKERGYKLRWYVLGEGEERSFLENEIKKRGLEEDFFLFGTVRNPYPYLRESQIYLQCSSYEGFSIAVREAKILGLAIVLSHSVGIGDLITDGADGIYVDAKPLNVADGVERLITNPDLLRRLGEAAAETNQKHEDILQLLQLIKD